MPIKTIGCVTDVIEIPCWKNQLPSMTSKRSHHLITLLMLIGRANSTETQLTKMAQACNVIDLMVEKT